MYLKLKKLYLFEINKKMKNNSKAKQLTNKKLDNLSQTLSLIALGSLIFVLIGLHNIDNYLNWLLFSFAKISIGFTFGLIIYFLLTLKIPEAKHYKNEKGITLIVPILTTFVFTFWGIGSIINEAKFIKKECKEYIIEEIGESSLSTSKAYYVFIKNGKQIERISFGKSFNQNHNVGDKITLCVITGCLGFEYYKFKN